MIRPAHPTCLPALHLDPALLGADASRGVRSTSPDGAQRDGGSRREDRRGFFWRVGTCRGMRPSPKEGVDLRCRKGKPSAGAGVLFRYADGGARGWNFLFSGRVWRRRGTPK